jgi:hypothetical protein
MKDVGYIIEVRMEYEREVLGGEGRMKEVRMKNVRMTEVE